MANKSATKTIYNVYVKMESQEQCDRMKQVCFDNGLPYSKKEIAFEYDSDFGNAFRYTECNQFGVYEPYNKTKVTESEFLKLLKTTK